MISPLDFYWFYAFFTSAYIDNIKINTELQVMGVKDSDLNDMELTINQYYYRSILFIIFKILGLIIFFKSWRSYLVGISFIEEDLF